MQNEYCTLDPVSRTITLTEPEGIAGVESDENARGLKFKFPKTVDSIDLTQMQLRINFMNSRGEKGQHIVTDVKPCEGEEDYITFTWPFSRLVTRYKGLTKFIVCAVKTDGDGTITAEWNTALTQLRVLEGLEITEADFSPEEKDIVTQLIFICQSAVDAAALAAGQANEEAEKVLTYGPKIGENGNWFVGGEDTGTPARGEKGEKGANGEKGETGTPGKDGATPEIGENGNWYIDGEDTGKPSRGEKGEQGVRGEKGEAGATGADGLTPEIGENGNWFIGGGDTEKPSRGESGELLLAEYIHQGNQEIYFSSFDWAAGIGECTAPHGLTKTTRIMIVPNDWWQSDFTQRGLCIPFEWCMYSDDLYAEAVDENHVKIVGAPRNTTNYGDIPVDAENALNVNLDCTQFHLEIGIPFEITDFPVKPASIRTTISGFITGGYAYRHLYTDGVMEDGAKNMGIYNMLLYVPVFGAISKPRHVLYQTFDMTVDLNGTDLIPFQIISDVYGRRASGGTNLFLQEEGIENTVKISKNLGYGAAHGGYKYISALRCSPGWPVYSNHSVIKVYAKAVTQ